MSGGEAWTVHDGDWAFTRYTNGSIRIQLREYGIFPEGQWKVLGEKVLTFHEWCDLVSRLGADFGVQGPSLKFVEMVRIHMGDPADPKTQTKPDPPDEEPS
jgi:hypothetical protein